MHGNCTPKARTARAGWREARPPGARAAAGAAGIVAFLLLAGTVVRGQFASGVTLVEVYATVSDARGQPITDLEVSDFKVNEDGVPQTVSAFAAGDFPLAVALAIDRSWSMSGRRLPLAKQAARTFLERLRPVDRAMIIAVASDTQVAAPLSNERTAAARALAEIKPWSSTALHDAVIACIDAIQPATGRRALILLSDGADRYSHATAADALAHARQSDVLVYPIALGAGRSQLFAELAVQTGGRSFALDDPREIEPTFTAIARELRHQYLLGYAPLRPLDRAKPEWRSIQVTVSRAGARVRARNGYVAK